MWDLIIQLDIDVATVMELLIVQVHYHLTILYDLWVLQLMSVLAI
jgi:hypothetical protein